MFDFMKDLYLEINGFDMEEIERQRQAQIEKEKSEKIILKKKTKLKIIIFFLIYLLVCGIGIYLSIYEKSIVSLIKCIIVAIFSLSTIILLFIKNKKTEIIGIICMIITILITFLPSIT